MATGRNESVGAEAIEPVAAPVEGVEKGTPPVEVPKAKETEEVIEISEADVGAVEEVLGKIEPDKIELDMSPLEDKDIIGYLKKIHGAMIKISGVSVYRSEKSKYLCWTFGKRKAVANVHLNKSKARLGVAQKNGDTIRFNRYKVTADGIFDGDSQLSLKDLVKAVRAYIKARGW